jgi:hypothetical protein
MEMTSAELLELMQDSANNAIRTTLEEFDIELDNSHESLSLVDDVILSWIDKYKDRALEDDAVFTICNIYGAYIGEIFRKTIGGIWLYDTNDKAAPFILLSVGEKSYAFAGICYERLVNDSQVSVKEYFDQAVSNNAQ